MSQQENFKAIRKVQEYLGSHINERITLQSLSKISGYSPYHLAHLFKATLGMCPLTYLRKLRLTEASLRIRDHQ